MEPGDLYMIHITIKHGMHSPLPCILNVAVSFSAGLSDNAIHCTIALLFSTVAGMKI